MDMSTLLSTAVKEKASDLHITPHTAPVVRIHGDLTPLKSLPPLSPEEAKQLIYSVMTKSQQEDFENHLEFDMALHVEEIGNFRVNVMHELNGIAAVFRLIPEHVPTFEELDLPPILKTLSILPHGLILITGPTGSGKSTTLAAILDYINTHCANHIITIEDPIEFVFQNKKSIINQRQVNRDTVDVTTALRSSLRQDPDVIMLGEMRDVETVRLALTAAETGHLVLATMHASTSPLAISRIVDMFQSADKSRIRNLLSESIQAVICQTLVKRAGGGQVAAFEIMLANAAIRHMIREDKIAHMVMTIQTCGDIGMCTLDQYLQLLVARNIICSSTARSITAQQDWFLV